MRHIQLYALVDRRKRRKTALARSLRRRTGRLWLGCGAFALLFILAVALGGGLLYVSLVQDLPSLAQLPRLLDPQDGLLMEPTRIYDRTGRQILLSLENPGISRRYVSLDPNQPEYFSPELIRVTVGALDPGFWSTPGFSLRSLTSNRPETIAERLVDSLLLWQEPPSLRRALRLRILAAQVVARYGHVQVLEWYLNSASFGHLAFGADSAAQLYLDKPAAHLTLPEAALLVAAIQAPALNVLDAPDAAKERQRAVLDDLLLRRVITQEEHVRASLAPLQVADAAGRDATSAAAFTRMVVDRLADRLGRERLERGGLKVVTTMDYALQLELICLTRTQLARLERESDVFTMPDGSPCESARLLPTLPPGLPKLPEGTASSAVVLDPRTGEVLAMLGDTTLDGEGQYLSPREPGSLLSPFVAVTGFTTTISPGTLLWDIPPDPDEDDRSLPSNPDDTYHGPVRLRVALANDYLAPLARMYQQIGGQNVWKLSAALGLNGLPDETGPELLYGGGRVTPLEIAQAYGIFANQGTRVGQRLSGNGELLPATVRYVVDLAGETVLDASQPEVQVVVSEQLSYLIHHILSDATARWPSLGYPNPLEIGRPSAGKVGQVADGSQVWTVGYTPQRATVIWLGLPAKGELKLNPRMAAGMWHGMMQYTVRDLAAEGWAVPPGISEVDVCDPSGLLPTADCPEIVTEVFLNGSEPTAPDNLYQSFQINRETGRLATVFTPAALVEEQTFMVVPANAGAWARAAGLSLPPEAYDAIQPPETSPDARITTPALYDVVRGSVDLRGTAAGDGFRFYQIQVGQGLNPSTWLQVGPDGVTPVEGGVLAVWETPEADGLYAIRLVLVRENQRIESTAIQVTVDNTPPQVRIPYPLPGQEISTAQGKSILFRAEVSDGIGVDQVIWYVDGRVVGQTAQEPYVFSWQAKPGEHVLEVRAVDRAGNEQTSEAVPFSVK